MLDALPEERTAQLTLRQPNDADGASIWSLVAASPPLDRNSRYCNLLQCSHFAGTSILAENDRGLAGWISGYRVPEQPQTLFVWQVAIAEAARGLGLANRLILDLVARPSLRDVTQISTTITSDNDASWALFRSVARDLQTDIQSVTHFDKQAHFDGAHDTEHLVTIGPF